ncbi:VWA domain-containing protein [Planctomyces sp. SH-PL14]|uniref:VWA domain-containing protein n=1 Tax=Planctomyces sp. SH-PL14 TaxID=1632864 RepID=UPI00078DA486|nr:VWA domain-containing protein [Planctomyces sp. SH-PL14]AMV19134.1 von Willebrand factor type A domain protein [Planctomyces sp. SH-PL14]
MLTLAAPWWLLLIAAPLLIGWLVPAWRPARAAVAVPFLDRLARLTGRSPSSGGAAERPPRFQRLALWSVWLLTVLALARPQWLEPPLRRTVPTRDLLLAVDLSGSMETKDFTNATGQKVDRLTAVKEVLDDFLNRRQGDRVALVFFGSAPFLQTTFTEDLDACHELLAEAQVRMAGPKTVLGDAVGLALTVFDKDSTIPDRVIIALTDGNDTGSQVPPEQAARIAHDRGITIHTVAVGDPAAAGEEKLDEATLKSMARTTGGRYAHAADRAALAAIYRDLDALRTRPAETITHRPRHELFHWPLGIALVLSLVWQAVRILRLPAESATGSRPLAPAATAVALLLAAGLFPAALSDLHFLRPWWLLGLGPAVWLLAMLRRRGDPLSAWRRAMDPRLLRHLVIGADARSRWGPLAALAAGWLLAIVAVAGPAWRRVPSPFSRDDAALVLVVKVTPDMLAQDIQPSRLARAGQKIADILERRKGTRAALVAYAGSAHLVMPLTHDATQIDRFATALDPAIMPVEGDDPAAALKLAQAQLARARVPGSVILLADSFPADAWKSLPADWSRSGPPVQVLAVAAPPDAPVPPGSPPAPPLDREALSRSVAALSASFVPVTPDDSDVEALTNRTVTRLVASKADDTESRWEDSGYVLLYPLALLVLLWFRPGWFVFLGSGGAG